MAQPRCTIKKGVCEGDRDTFLAVCFLSSDTCCQGWDDGGRDPGRKAAKALGKRISTLCRDATLENHVQKRSSKCPRVSDPAGREKLRILPEWYLSEQCVQAAPPCLSQGESAVDHEGMALVRDLLTWR